MPLNTHGTRAVMEIKTLTLRSDTRCISSQTAFPESCTRVPGCRYGWGPVGPRCCTLTSEKTSGGELSTGGDMRGEARCWRWRLLAFCVRRLALAAPLQLRQDWFPTAPNPVAVVHVKPSPCILWKVRNRTLHLPGYPTLARATFLLNFFSGHYINAQMFAQCAFTFCCTPGRTGA